MILDLFSIISLMSGVIGPGRIQTKLGAGDESVAGVIGEVTLNSGWRTGLI